MLTNWFKTRTPRSLERNRFFRPQLECLEGRLAPSSLVPLSHGNGNGNGNGHGHGNGGDPPPAPVAGPVVNQSGNVHNNIHITNSFNGNTGSFNNIASIPGAVFLSPIQAGEIGVLFAFSTIVAVETSNTSLGSLINDEITLAVDKYLVSQPAIMAVSSLTTSLNADISMLNAAIAANPLEGTLIGQAIGTLVFDVTINALTTAQPTI
jgi:hypothetical protein